MKAMRWLMLAVGLIGATQAATLKVGDPAPKLDVGKWIQGDPVTAFEKDKAYIVEFWATWCGPCVQTIPHVNDLHKKFKDKGLVVIGQDVWEQDESEVPRFVKKMGDKMTYRVALDNKKTEAKGKMAVTWMEAAGQNGIPSAFVVDKSGSIAWIGHPAELDEKILEEVLSGKFDIKKAAAAYERKKAQEEKTSALWQTFSKAAQGKDWAKAESTLNEIEQVLEPEDRGNVDMMRLRIAFSKKDNAAAEKLAAKLAQSDSKNAMYHNQLAWMLVTMDEKPSKAILDVAEKAAARANELSEGKSGEIVDTVARVQFMRGDKDAAIKSQQKAIDLMTDDRAKKAFTKTLDSYKKGELPKE